MTEKRFATRPPTRPELLRHIADFETLLHTLQAYCDKGTLDFDLDSKEETEAFVKKMHSNMNSCLHTFYVFSRYVEGESDDAA